MLLILMFFIWFRYWWTNVDVNSNIVCDVILESVDSCCDVVSTHDYLPIDNVAMNWIFEIDMKELENVKGGRRVNKHVEMWANNSFDE